MIKLANNLAKVHLKHSAFSDYLQNPQVQYGGGGALIGAGLGALINKLRGGSALKGALIGGVGGAGLGLAGYHVKDYLNQMQAAKTKQQAEKAQAEAQAAIQKADQENQARVMAGEAGPARVQKDKRMASGGPPPDAAEQGRRAVNEARMWWDNFKRQVTRKGSTPQPPPPDTVFNPQTKRYEPTTPEFRAARGLPEPMSTEEINRLLQADADRRRAEYEAARQAAEPMSTEEINRLLQADADRRRAEYEAARQAVAGPRISGGGSGTGASIPTMFE